MLENDKTNFQIKCTDEQISALSKQKFKNFVKKRANELTVKYLQKLKRKNSKSNQLEVENLEISPYLQDARFSREEREVLFQLRSKTIQVKENFRNAYIHNDMLCVLCRLFPCAMSHPLHCPELNSKMVVDKKLNINENFIYGTTDQQLLYVKIFKQFWDLRKTQLNKEK